MKAIPKIDEPELFEKITLSHSEFIKLKNCDVFDIKMQYSLMGLKNSISDCYVRKELLNKLIVAKSLLPSGIKFRILDAWRPMALQLELYNLYSKAIIDRFNLENVTEEMQNKIINKYVSYPSYDVLLPPVHTTGGAVDLTLIDDVGNELDMGTGFDSFSNMSKTDYYEVSAEKLEIRNNRRILYNAMIGAGFTNLPSEWWHYDFGDRFWAYYNRTPALYEGVFTIGGIQDETKSQ